MSFVSSDKGVRMRGAVRLGVAFVATLSAADAAEAQRLNVDSAGVGASAGRPAPFTLESVGLRPSPRSSALWQSFALGSVAGFLDVPMWLDACRVATDGLRHWCDPRRGAKEPWALTLGLAGLAAGTWFRSELALDERAEWQEFRRELRWGPPWFR
jgi:hypothetical protein